VKARGWTLRFVLLADVYDANPDWTIRPDQLQRIAHLGAALEFDPSFLGD
jgi:hypothetical protein